MGVCWLSSHLHLQFVLEPVGAVFFDCFDDVVVFSAVVAESGSGDEAVSVEEFCFFCWCCFAEFADRGDV